MVSCAEISLLYLQFVFVTKIFFEHFGGNSTFMVCVCGFKWNFFLIDDIYVLLHKTAVVCACTVTRTCLVSGWSGSIW